METYHSTTPFGRRTLTLAHVASQAAAKSRPPGKAVHKWRIYQSICEAKVRLGVSERALAVLNALLTFHPETVLSGEDLIVFPSNVQLARRAHGMAPTTLRRCLGGLVDAGLIVRRDSPNGKRYARKNREGEVELAFGFDLGPLVARAEEFERLAAEVAAADRALKLVRERITLCRRDIAKMIAAAIEGGVPAPTAGEGGWAAIHALFRGILARIPRVPALGALEPIASELTLLADEVLTILENHTNSSNPDSTESHDGCHRQNSNTEAPIESEPAPQEGRVARVVATDRPTESKSGGFPLGMVLKACPDIADFAKDGISNWRDFLATVSVVRPMLGISPSAWEEARAVLDDIPAAIVVACILQRAEAINSAGGYLRGLTRKAEAGQFSLGPMLMALIGTRMREKRSA